MKEELPHKHSMTQFDNVDDADLYDPTKIAIFYLNRKGATKLIQRMSVFFVAGMIVFPLFTIFPFFAISPFSHHKPLAIGILSLVPLLVSIVFFYRFSKGIEEASQPVLEIHLGGLKLAFLGIMDFDVIPWQEISEIKPISRFGMNFVVIKLNSLDQLLDHALTNETRRQIEMAWHLSRLMEKLGMSMLAQPPISVPEFWLQLPAKDVADILDYRRSCFLQLGSNSDKDRG